MLWRWSQTEEAKNDPDYAPLKVFDIIGYGKTATSPVEAEPLKYLLPENKKITLADISSPPLTGKHSMDQQRAGTPVSLISSNTDVSFDIVDKSEAN
mgnify:CR=1 FL=1